MLDISQYVDSLTYHVFIPSQGLVYYLGRSLFRVGYVGRRISIRDIYGSGENSLDFRLRELFGLSLWTI